MSFNAPPGQQQGGFNAPPGAQQQQGFNAPPGSQGEGQEVYHGGVVREEQPIRAGQFIANQSQTAFLYLHQDGNLALYSDRTFKNKIWESHTAKKGDAPHQAKLVADGTLQVLDRNMKPTFTVKLQGKATAPHKLVLQNDRNLVIYDRNLHAIYSVNAEKTHEKFEHDLAVETKKLEALKITETAAEKHLHKLQQDLVKLQKEVNDQEQKVKKEKTQIQDLNKKIDTDRLKQAETVQKELAATKEPQQQGFNAPPQQQQQQGGFNAPPQQQGGFNAPPQQQGFNAPPQQQGGFNAPPKH